MKKSLFFLALFIPFLLSGQAEKYYQVETIRLDPNPELIVELGVNMAAHNKKYHAAAPYNAAVFNITSGEDAGQLVWLMGPTTFTELDGRPSAGGHDEDWVANVVTKLEGASHGEYWRRDKDRVLNAPAAGTPPFPVYRVRYFTVTKGQGHRVDVLLNKIHATLKDIGGTGYWATYSNQFRQGYENGRHIVAVTGMQKWAEFDKDIKFREHFEKLYGARSLDDFNLEMNEVFTNVWDEIWSLNKKMSGIE